VTNWPLLQEAVTAQAERWPETPAVVWGRQVLPYRDLETRANQLARMLRESGCRRGDRVCLLAPRGPEAVVAILAILKADAIVVPLDVDTPPARLAEVIRISAPRCVLTFSAGAARLDEVLRCEPFSDAVAVGSLGASPVVGEHFSTVFCATDVAGMPTRALASRNRPSSPAHIVFSLRARGTPRGAVQSHESIRRALLWSNNYFDILPGDRHPWRASPSNGRSIFATLGTLAAGATVHPLPPEVGLHPERLAAFVWTAALTKWVVTPQTLAAAIHLMQPGDCPQLRNVVWYGGPMPAALLRESMARLRHVSFTGLYGATEAAVVSCYHRVLHPPESDETLVPIGVPRPGEGALVLDDCLQTVAPGTAGQIHLRGTGLSPGYWRDPVATAAEFVTPAGGRGRLFRTGDLGYVGMNSEIYLTGRRDRRASRERSPRQIESALMQIGSVRAVSVVAVRTGETDGPIFGCAYVPLPGIDVTPAGLRADLSAMLPSHLLPSRWRAYAELPRADDGTVNIDEVRNALADPASALPWIQNADQGRVERRHRTRA
jgi:non-ribosomal peptide synthetase component F